MPYPKQTDEQRRKMLAQELSHRGSGYIPNQEEINTSIDVGMGRKPADIAYGEQGLRGGTEIGEIGGMPISATDVIPGGSLAKLAAMLKVGGTGLAALGGGMGIMNKMGAASVPSRFRQAGGLVGKTDMPKFDLSKFKGLSPDEQGSALEQWGKANGVDIFRSGASNKSDSLYYTVRKPKDFDPEYGYLDSDTAHIRVGSHFNQTNTDDYLNAIKRYNIHPEGDDLQFVGDDLLEWLKQQ